MLGTLLFYTFICFFVYFLASWQYKKCGRRSCKNDGSVVTKKMPLYMALILGALCLLYNVYVTETSPIMGGDRTNYQYTYEYERVNESAGLTLLMNVGRMYNVPFVWVLYISTFVSMCLAFLAYRYSREATPYALLMFLLTFYLNASLSAVKQSYAMGCSTLLFMLLLQKHTVLKDAISILLVLIACSFHVTGFILIPLYIILRVDSKYLGLGKSITILAISAILFIPLISLLGNLSGTAFSLLSEKTDLYFGKNGVAETGIMAVFKGLPFFYISTIAIKYRKLLTLKIPDFNKYLLLSLMGSLFYLLSYYDVWMARFEFSFGFAIMVLWCRVVKYVPNKEIHKIAVMSLLALFTYRHLILIYINFGGF